MKMLFLLLSFFSVVTISAQNHPIEATWKIDSFAPTQDAIDEMDLLTIAALAMLDEDDKTEFLKIESQSISLLNAKQTVLKTSDYYRIENEVNENETTIIIDEMPFLFVLKDDNYAELTGSGVIYYLRK